MSLTDDVREHGPITSEELGSDLNMSMKRNGIASFRPILANSSNARGHEGVNSTSVFYAIDEHDKEDVIREWFDAHPRLQDVESSSIAQAVGCYGDSWREAWQNVKREFYEYAD
jgi:hypothetical protein